MTTALIISQILSWLLIIALGVALLAVARQVGVLHERVAPVGALVPRNGPKAGQPVPHLVVRTLTDAVIEIGGTQLRPGRTLLFFVSADCPICKKLIPFAKSFARDEKIELIFVGDDHEAVQRRLVSVQVLDGYPFVNDSQLGQLFAVDKLPHAVLIGADGRLIARGLVNSREHLESMIAVEELGVASVQEYLRDRVRAHG